MPTIQSSSCGATTAGIWERNSIGANSPCGKRPHGSPFMIAAPRVTKANGRCGRTVDLMDVYPTLCELCALPIGDHLQGKSLVPLLTDPQASWHRPALTTHGRNNHAVRSERWRYIRYADGSQELYDHDNDPLEWVNLAQDDRFASVKRELAKWLPKVNAENAATDKKLKNTNP